MASHGVVCQKHDANGNLIGMLNPNHILDTCLYEVEFPGKGNKSWQQISLKSQCMPNVMLMGICTFY